MALFLLAIAAGALTILAPCILPVLPIILGVGTGQSKLRPLFVIGGFIFAFSIFGAAFATAGTFLGISNEVFRTVAVVLLVLFGLALIFETLYQKITAGVSAKLQQVGSKISAGGTKSHGAGGGILVGLSLGLIWTPCAGPILGAILTLAATDGDFLSTAILFAAYALGAGLPMLLIAYGGQWFFKKISKVGAKVEILNKLFGLLILLTAVAIATGFDKELQVVLLDLYPEGFLKL